MLEGVGSGIGMDSSVVASPRYPDMRVVSTTDFFYPLVEDPYMQGRIACANVLSDMYAMGVPFVDNTLMILASSLEMAPADREIVTREMIRGYDELSKEAGTSVTGGQTVLNPWPIIGGVAKSICKDSDIIMPVSAVAGDVIVLTKPIGTQVAVNVKQWMNADDGDAKKEQVRSLIGLDTGNRAYHKAMRQMARLNKTGAEMMHKYDAHAATDVTGFGILGHLDNLASNQKAKVSLELTALPVLRGMTAVDDAVSMFKLRAGYSAETSGGLMVCLPAANAEAFCADMQRLDGEPCWVVGRVVAGDNTARIVDDVKIIEV